MDLLGLLLAATSSSFQLLFANALLQGRLALNNCLKSREQVGYRTLARREDGMPRAATAVFVGGVVLVLSVAAPVAGASHLIVKQTAGDSNSGPEKGGMATPEKAPARQVPVEPIEDPIELSADQYDLEAARDQQDKSGVGSGGQMSPGAEAAAPASEMEREASKKVPHASPLEIQPGLPVRKPPKPIVRRKPAGRNSADKPPSRSERDKKLCKALQSCRNEFVRCKNKIKHADQSEAWIIAKEVCGSYYQTCVEKDFQSGEWFFTRWFYFKDLDCK